MYKRAQVKCFISVYHEICVPLTKRTNISDDYADWPTKLLPNRLLPSSVR